MFLIEMYVRVHDRYNNIVHRKCIYFEHVNSFGLKKRKIKNPNQSFVCISCSSRYRLFCFIKIIFLFSPPNRTRQEAQAETPEENDVHAGRDHVRQAVADGTVGHGDDRRQSAQGPAAGRRLAHHIQAHVTQEVQRRRLRRRRRGRLRGPGRLVVGQGRPERSSAGLRGPVGRCGHGVRHVAVLATAAADVPVVRTSRLPRGRLTARSTITPCTMQSLPASSAPPPPPPPPAPLELITILSRTVTAPVNAHLHTALPLPPSRDTAPREGGSRASSVMSGKLVTSRT